MTTVPTASPSKLLVFILALGAGIAVACLYYAQPILPLLQSDLTLSAHTIGLVPTLTQIGYAVGIFFLIPLGDRYNRRHLILLKSLLLCLTLVWFSLSNSAYSLLFLSLMIGILATMAQDIVPSAAILAPTGQQGKFVGTVMTGLLLGILLSRTASGLISAALGWRAMYQIAALSVALVAIGLWRVLPQFKTHVDLSYAALLGSMLKLWKKYPALRHAALAQGLLSVAFSAFWSTLALMVAQQYHYGSVVAGAFGLAGAAGALAAPLAGILSDRRGSHYVTKIGAALVLMSFLFMFSLPLVHSIVMQLMIIALAAVGFDLGLQASLVSHQTLVYGLDPAARGRLNGILFTGVFLGMALGSYLGNLMFTHGGWLNVVALACISALLSLMIRLYEGRRLAKLA
ncbi:MFS transporter [Acinetobacter sp. MD2(2019)]|uniref:MFS transporter n=1 Tax=Acinetobacter sp. MD2(2019) TaxID=2605273 RepID=UPI002D1F0E69|nr:MFS transporter [Acinetobacter sp. MD2(2019)]MEB3754991.1 MFS transporter [Acinetobacter sp. MD2(2019)]